MENDLDPDRIRERFAALFGYGWQGAAARAIGTHPVNLSKQLAGLYPVPVSTLAILELLEATTPARWPERWQKLADMAKAKAAKDRAAADARARLG
jgi:hypothetical protein